MSLWWLQPGWTQTKCSCGATIWPEGDPDWGACYSCFSQEQAAAQYAEDEAARYYAELEQQSANSVAQSYSDMLRATRPEPNS
jgi:hypothetical protein